MKIEPILELINNVARQVITISGTLSILLLALTGVIVTAILGVWMVNFALRALGF